MPIAWADVIEAKGLVDDAIARRPALEPVGGLTFTLPLCPSTNNLYLNKGKKRIKTKAYRDWSERAAGLLKAVPKWAGGYPVAIDITIVGGKGWTLGCDVGNREKACTDALVNAGIIFNDSCKHISDVRVRYEPGVSKALPAVMRVVVREA